MNDRTTTGCKKGMSTPLRKWQSTFSKYIHNLEDRLRRRERTNQRHDYRIDLDTRRRRLFTALRSIDPSPLRIQRSIDTGAFRPPVNIWIGRISAQKEAKRARGGPGFRAECSYYSTLARHARLAARLPAMLKPGLTVINMRLEVCKRIVPWLAADRWSGKKIPIWWTGALTSSPSLYHGFPPCCSSSLRFLYFFPFLVSL